MPLLPPEPFVYPEGLLKQTLPPAPDSAWWVLHTRPRAEKSVARAAFRRGVPFFLPLYTRRWRNQGRTFTARLPLFPGYVFLHADADGREIVYDRTQVANCLRVPDQERMWQDLVRVFDLMTSGHPMTPEEKLPPGARVVITDGPLRGLEGKVIRHGTQCRLVLEVAFIQRGVSVELENWMVKPAGRESGPERLVAGPAGSR